jgi:hypothetical protein
LNNTVQLMVAVMDKIIILDTIEKVGRIVEQQTILQIRFLFFQKVGVLIITESHYVLQN